MRPIYLTAAGIVIVLCVALLLHERIAIDVVVGDNHFSLYISAPENTRKPSSQTVTFSYLIRDGPKKKPPA